MSFFELSAQSKKEQIEILTDRVDSLNQTIDLERTKSNDINKAFLEKITKLESQIAFLRKENESSVQIIGQHESTIKIQKSEIAVFKEKIELAGKLMPFQKTYWELYSENTENEVVNLYSLKLILDNNEITSIPIEINKIHGFQFDFPPNSIKVMTIQSNSFDYVLGDNEFSYLFYFEDQSTVKVEFNLYVWNEMEGQKNKFPQWVKTFKITPNQATKLTSYSVFPSRIELLELTTEGEKIYNLNRAACEKIWDKISKGADSEKLPQFEKDILAKCDETKEDYWDIIGGGCSWYCGGGPDSVIASSFLSSTNSKNEFEARNAKDLNYKTVWVEGVKGYGIGEFLEYNFKAVSAPITEIKIVNGFVKSQTLWENNSRVKKLKVYIDNELFTELNLEDIRGVQTFKFNPIGKERNNDLPDWKLKFEIAEVYKGLKYDDVVISEIFFDGIGVHCFAKGTKVDMLDNSKKNIEDLQIGDSIKTMDLKTGKINFSSIEKMESVSHHNLVKYTFESGQELIATEDHPLKLKNEGWGSLNPNKSIIYKGFDLLKHIKINDYILTASGSDKIIDIKFIPEDQPTYTISKLSNGNNFIANGIVVGIEQLTFELKK
jgi:DNA-binding XRE family transcriptional regulator